MELAGIWSKCFSLRYVPITMIQVLSAAATIFVVQAVQAVSGPRIAHIALELAEKNAEDAIQYLRKVGESFASALKVADILQHLLQGQVHTRKARRSPGSSPSSLNNSPPLSWQFPHSPPNGNVSGLNGESNVIASPSWMEFINPPLDSIYANAQHSMGHPNVQYSTLEGALETPFSYHHPFGDGLGESPFLPVGATLPGVNGSIARGDVTNDSLMRLRSSQEALYAYQIGMPAIHFHRH